MGPNPAYLWLVGITMTLLIGFVAVGVSHIGRIADALEGISKIAMLEMTLDLKEYNKDDSEANAE